MMYPVVSCPSIWGGFFVSILRNCLESPFHHLFGLFSAHRRCALLANTMGCASSCAPSHTAKNAAAKGRFCKAKLLNGQKNAQKYGESEILNSFLERGGAMGRRVRRERLQFSKRLMVFASVMYALTWLVLVVSWAVFRELPQELMLYSTWLYGTAVGFYCSKSAYENGCKLKKGGGKP